MKTDVRFDSPVSIALGPSKNVMVNVVSASEAAEILFTRWPARRGRRHLEARKAAMAALEGLQQPAAFRHAFVEAAREAEILIEAGDQ
ncbi:DUF982 domain-containing protein [Mesorhizobium sp. CGMCC 1.15528]|uniref:DUF982 domain-containing protein n=1 Tax=Mesorhizobium zhangyense TaxID=1776730 RepID=A0A7C9RCR0_9HYPH|nr:DUF982 domain-containing protein [Mesorhizobium zhangyense]NGN45317.1 DUF982 domain-containing protein [Mesorhizobium zhangyense]